MAKPTNAELIKKNQALESELKEQKEALLELQKTMENLKPKGANAEMVTMKEPFEDKYKTEEFNIRPDEYVEVVSLCPNDLYLSRSLRDENPLKFETLGERKHLLYSELIAIINHHPRFAKNGDFYIPDIRIVKRHGLIDFYDKILTKDEIYLVMTSDSDEAIKMFKKANMKQQEYLSDMLIAKIIKGENVDMNMVYKMGQILGTDIAKSAEDAKEFGKLLIKE